MPAGNRRPLYSADDLPAAAPPATSTQPSDLPQESTASLVQAAPDATFRQPCTFKGLASAAYAGALGYFLGFVPATIKFKARQWGMIHSQGMASASQLALMSGMYTAVHCICQRIRTVEDGWNRGIAGCSTGLVLGWQGGPWSALQSCAGIGLLSALIDLGGGAVEAAEASMLCQMEQLHHNSNAQQQQKQQQLSVQQLGNPFQKAMLLMASLTAVPQLLQQQQQQHQYSAGTAQFSGVNFSSSLRAVEQQHLVAAAANPTAGPLPAAIGTAAQQLLAAPPLAFLSACCSSSSSSSSAASAVSVDACELKPTQPQQRKKGSRRQQD